MFERNTVDNSLRQAPVTAELTYDDGRTVKGRIHFAAARTLYDVLNGNGAFLDFETFEGERAMIAKTTIRAVKILPVAQAPSLKARAESPGEFDPHRVLGLAHGATWEEIRAAYLALSKAYHPDRFAGVSLPAEVAEYLSVMSRRINLAYASLEEPQVTKQARLERAKPVYTSPQRF